MEGPPDNEFCSICHDVFNCACQANCSHWFCGDSIITVIIIFKFLSLSPHIGQMLTQFIQFRNESFQIARGSRDLSLEFDTYFGLFCALRNV